MVDSRWKRILAREWLVFLVVVVASALGLLMVVALHALYTGGFQDFFEDFVQDLDGDLILALLLLGLMSYGAVQLIRSIVWAVRALRR